MTLFLIDGSIHWLFVAALSWSENIRRVFPLIWTIWICSWSGIGFHWNDALPKEKSKFNCLIKFWPNQNSTSIYWDRDRRLNTASSQLWEEQNSLKLRCRTRCGDTAHRPFFDQTAARSLVEVLQSQREINTDDFSVFSKTFMMLNCLRCQCKIDVWMEKMLEAPTLQLQISGFCVD